MNNYIKYTLEHQNEEMIEEDWDQVDKAHRQIAIRFFRALGARDITLTKGNNCIDMLFTTKHGTRCCCELKDRRMETKTFGDVMIEKVKYDAIQRRKDRGEFEKAFAMNHYPDGSIRLTNIFKNDYKLRSFYCPKSSYVKGVRPELVKKECCLFQDFYEFDFVDGKYILVK